MSDLHAVFKSAAEVAVPPAPLFERIHQIAARRRTRRRVTVAAALLALSGSAIGVVVTMNNSRSPGPSPAALDGAARCDRFAATRHIADLYPIGPPKPGHENGMNADQAVTTALSLRDDPSAARPPGTSVRELTLGEVERVGGFQDDLVPMSRCVFEVVVPADRTFHVVGQLKLAHSYTMVFDVATGNELESIGNTNSPAPDCKLGAVPTVPDGLTVDVSGPASSAANSDGSRPRTAAQALASVLLEDLDTVTSPDPTRVKATVSTRLSYAAAQGQLGDKGRGFAVAPDRCVYVVSVSAPPRGGPVSDDSPPFTHFFSVVDVQSGAIIDVDKRF